MQQDTKHEIEVLSNLSQRAAAWAFGVDVRTIRRWELPMTPEGKYDMHTVIALKTAESKCSDDAERLLRAKADKEEQLAKKETLNVGKIDDSMINREEVHDVMTKFAGHMRSVGKHYAAAS